MKSFINSPRPLFEQAKIMGAKEVKLLCQKVNRWSQAANCSAERRRQRDPATHHRESGKELAYLGLPNPPDIRIGRIIKGEVVPQEPSTRGQHAIDFASNLALHAAFQHGGEQHELRNKLKAAIGKWKVRGGAANHLQIQRA